MFGDVFEAGAVAGFASDSEFGDPCAELAGSLDKSGVAAGAVASDALVVPLCEKAFVVVRAVDEGGFAGDPSLFLSEPDEGQRVEDGGVARAGNPIGLVVMRAGGEDDGTFDAGDFGKWFFATSLNDIHHDVGVGHFGHELITLFEDLVEEVFGGDGDIGELA